MYDIDDKMKTVRRERVSQTVMEVVGKLDRKYTRNTTFAEITDDDDLMAIQRLSHKDAANMSSLVNRLKTECIKAKLQEIEDKIENEGEHFRMKWRPYFFFRDVFDHPDKDIQRDAKRIWDKVKSITLDDIGRKYNTSTKLHMLSEADKDAIKGMYVKGVNDPNFNETQLHLHWSLMQEDVETHHDKFLKEKKSFQMRERTYKRLKYFSKGDVPLPLKTKANSFLSDLDRCFGRGRVPIQR